MYETAPETPTASTFARLRPDCVSEPAGMPRLDPRPMPELPRLMPVLLLACPTPQDGTTQRYRKPLWRSFERLARN